MRASFATEPRIGEGKARIVGDWRGRTLPNRARRLRRLRGFFGFWLFLLLAADGFELAEFTRDSGRAELLESFVLRSVFRQRVHELRAGLGRDDFLLECGGVRDVIHVLERLHEVSRFLHEGLHALGVGFHDVLLLSLELRFRGFCFRHFLALLDLPVRERFGVLRVRLETVRDGLAGVVRRFR
jgi:hypothetical protein